MDKVTFIKEADKLLPTYQPNEQVRQHLTKVELVPTVGPTGSGKTSIMQGSGIYYVLGDVTRSPRADEIDGVHYNFRSDYDQLLKEIKNGEFVQYVVRNDIGEFYGTRDSAFPPSGPCSFAIIARTIPGFYKMGFKLVRPVYILPPSFKEWMRRVGIHNDKDVAMRLQEAKESLGIALKDDSYIFLINDDLSKAVEEFRNIALGRIDNKHFEQGRKLAENLYQELA